MPVVSVIVVTYNSEPYVLETLQSVHEQSYQPVELIISDDGSRDSTVATCSKWLRANGARFINATIVTAEQNTGIAPNCNRGIQAAQGKWIKLIAGDDALETDIIRKYIQFAGSHPDASILSSNVQPYQGTLRDAQAMPVQSLANIAFNKEGVTAMEQFQILLRHNFVAAPTVMLKKEVIEAAGGFDESIVMMEDWPMWLTLTKAGHKIHFLDIVGAKYRLHPLSINSGGDKNVYKSKVEIGIDRMFQNKYLLDLPIAERLARRIVIYRNAALVKLSGNKKSFWVSALSKAIGALPVSYLRKKISDVNHDK